MLALAFRRAKRTAQVTYKYYIGLIAFLNEEYEDVRNFSILEGILPNCDHIGGERYGIHVQQLSSVVLSKPGVSTLLL